MSLKLVWTNDATAYTDHNLEYVVINVLAAKPETFQIGQAALLDAFRKAVVYGLIEPSDLSLDVNGDIRTFDEYGKFVPHSPWPTPDLPGKLVRDILKGQGEISKKKRAEKDARSVD
ncbi:hypothetical protein D3C80_1225570 [compost metagenome]